MMRMHKKEGITVWELSSIYKMSFKSVKNVVTRENNKTRRMGSGIEPRWLGRLPKGYKLTENQKDNEIKQLRWKMGHTVI